MSESLANRLRRMQRHLRKWARREGITCYRLYEKDIPDQPLIIDWYDGRALVYAMRRKRDETEAAREAWLAEVEAAVLDGLDLAPDALYFKERAPQKAGSRYGKLADAREEFIVEECRRRFIVNLSDYHDTGLFLDHRPTRKRVGEEAAGRRFLNLFGYTGSFTVYAAKGGASSTTTVDLSNRYLSWAERNFRLNDLDPEKDRTVEADVLEWLPWATGQKRWFDLIVCDPPTFSNSKRMDGYLDVEQAHPNLINGCLKLLSRDGTLYFSTNFRGFHMKKEALTPCSMQEISAETIPPDFRNKRIHRCWQIRHR